MTAVAIGEVIKLLEDPPLRQRMGEQGYQTCLNKFNINEVVKKFENLYVELTRL